MEQQLKHHTDNVMNNQNDFALEFLPEFIAVFERVVSISFGAEMCLIIYDTRCYHGLERSIKTVDFLRWSAGE